MTQILLFAGIDSPTPAGSIPATSTKVSESPDCDNSSLEVSQSGLGRFFKWLVFHNPRPVSTGFPVEISVNISIKFSSSGKLRTTSPKGSKLSLLALGTTFANKG